MYKNVGELHTKLTKIEKAIAVVNAAIDSGNHTLTFDELDKIAALLKSYAGELASIPVDYE